jgi:hypothetical protein
VYTFRTPLAVKKQIGCDIIQHERINHARTCDETAHIKNNEVSEFICSMRQEENIIAPDKSPFDNKNGRMSPCCATALHQDQQRLSSSTSALANWLPDSGASSHHTPYFDDLVDHIPCYVPVMLADGSTKYSIAKGQVRCPFVADNGMPSVVMLHGVYHTPGLTQRLSSLTVISESELCSIGINSGKTKLLLSNGDTFTWPSQQCPLETSTSHYTHSHSCGKMAIATSILPDLAYNAHDSAITDIGNAIAEEGALMTPMAQIPFQDQTSFLELVLVLLFPSQCQEGSANASKLHSWQLLTATPIARYA